MKRESVVTLIFGGVLFLGIAGVAGLYLCTGDVYFWRGISFIGLIFDAIGALWLVLSEVREIQSAVSSNMAALHDQLDEATFEHDDAHSEWLEPGNVGFSQLQEIACERISMAHSHEKEEEVDIEYFTHWPDGRIYAYGTNSNQVTLGSPQEVRRWVFQEVSGRIERKSRLYAVILLFFGFGLQLYSHYIQFL